jgi:methionyl-tRNA formyltransferase
VLERDFFRFMKYIFVGGGYRGRDLLLNGFANECKLCLCIVLEEDSHEQHRYSREIVEFCEKECIPHTICKSLSSVDYEMIRGVGADFGIVCGWRSLIKIEKMGPVGYHLFAAHDSLLPRYRGFAPLSWAIINGEKETGITLFRINEGVDSGEIVAQERVEIGDREYVGEILARLSLATIQLFSSLVVQLTNGHSPYGQRQDEAKATYTCKRIPEDGKIEWDSSSKEIFNLVRALAPPYPGARCEYLGELYKIYKVELGKLGDRNYSGRIPGRVIDITDDSVEVLCGEGSIRIFQWSSIDEDTPKTTSKQVKSVGDTLQ